MQTEVRSDEQAERRRQVVLEARGLSKSYGGVLASDNIDLKIYRGEIVAIVGDNGAGKSTLVGMLCGAVQPDHGELELNGEPVSFHSPADARERGVETVYQGLALSTVLDVAGNLYLGREIVRKVPFLPKWLSVLNRGEMARRAEERMKTLQVRLPGVSKHPVSLMSGGQRQTVAISRAAIWATDVVFMDEPTAALGVAQSQAVLELARRLAAQGLAVVLITHTLPYVMEYADRVVVVRRGHIAADLAPSATTPEELVALIMGFRREVAA